jgi:hypothetical protein
VVVVVAAAVVMVVVVVVVAVVVVVVVVVVPCVLPAAVQAVSVRRRTVLHVCWTAVQFFASVTTGTDCSNLGI